MHFEVVGAVTNIETIAVGNAIRDIARLRRQIGSGRWGNLKGEATVQLAEGTLRRAEVHW